MMMGSAMVGWMWLWPALIAVGLLALAYVGISLGSTRRATSPPDADRATPRQILDERYARGEIGDDEYQHRRGMLP